MKREIYTSTPWRWHTEHTCREQEPTRMKRFSLWRAKILDIRPKQKVTRNQHDTLLSAWGQGHRSDSHMSSKDTFACDYAWSLRRPCSHPRGWLPVTVQMNFLQHKKRCRIHICRMPMLYIESKWVGIGKEGAQLKCRELPYTARRRKPLSCRVYQV